jgi:prophage regulatory protein
MNVINDKECKAKTGLSRSTRDRMIRQGRFPVPIQLSTNRIGFIESEVNDWLLSRQRGLLAPPLGQRLAHLRRGLRNPSELREQIEAEQRAVNGEAL